jgi:RNA polymerase sigma factor (sigma-70 family)
VRRNDSFHSPSRNRSPSGLPEVASPGTAEPSRDIGTALKQYGALVRAVASRFSPSPDDMLQETFVRAWTHLAECRDPAAMGGWLSRIAYRVGIDFSKAIAQRARVYERFVREQTPFNVTTDDLVEPQGWVEQDAAQAAWLRLPRKMRAICEARWISRLPVAEVARRFGISVAAVSASRAEQFASRLRAAEYRLRRRILFLTGGNADLADDIFQDVAVRLWQKEAMFSERGQWFHWALRVSDRVCFRALDRLRQEKLKTGRMSLLKDGSAEVPADWSPGGEEEAVANRISNAVARLPPRIRAAIIAAYWFRKSPATIAQEFDLKAKSVWTLLSQGRRLLADRLSELRQVRNADR